MDEGPLPGRIIQRHSSVENAFNSFFKSRTFGKRVLFERWPYIFISALLFPLTTLYARYLYAPSDDAYIFLVYARNFIEGNGLTYNGLVVEGFSSVSWVALLSILGLSGVPLPLLAEGLSLISGLLALFITYVLGRKLELTPQWALLPPILLAATGDFAFYASVGLDQVLFAASVTFCVLLSISKPPEDVLCSWWFPSSVALMVLTRPEGALVAAILLFSLALSANSLWLSIRCGIHLTLILVPFMILRYAYYGYWLPNTYYVKGNAGFSNLQHGIVYFRELLPRYKFLMLFFCVLGVWQVIKRGAHSLANLLSPLLIIVLWTLYIIVRGGDNMVGARAFVAILPLFYVTLVCLMHGVSIKLKPAFWGTALTCVCLILVYLFDPVVTAHRMSWRSATKVRERIGVYLRENFPSDTLIALNPAGIIPYYSGLPTIDMLGLNEPFIAHEGKRDFSLAFGHQVGDGLYVLSQKPDIIFMGGLPGRGRGAFLGDYEIWEVSSFHSDYELVEWPGVGYAFIREK